MCKSSDVYAEVEVLRGDAVALDRFLKKNPSTSHFSDPFPEHLDPAILSRVCFALESAMNRL